MYNIEQNFQSNPDEKTVAIRGSYTTAKNLALGLLDKAIEDSVSCVIVVKDDNITLEAKRRFTISLYINDQEQKTK